MISTLVVIAVGIIAVMSVWGLFVEHLSDE